MKTITFALILVALVVGACRVRPRARPRPRHRPRRLRVRGRSAGDGIDNRPVSNRGRPARRRCLVRDRRLPGRGADRPRRRATADL